MHINLTKYGYTSQFEQEAVSGIENGLIPARVIEVHKEFYKIMTENSESAAKLKGSCFYKDNADVGFPAVGDFVMVEFNPYGESIIHKILERKSKFSRSSSVGREERRYAKEQVVATNFDYVFIMQSLNDDFNLHRIERYLTAAWESSGIPVVVLTKSDLCLDYTDYKKQVEQIAKGVCVITVSVITGDGSTELKEFLMPGKTIVFLGSSGVGKSSIVNYLSSKELMKVNNIREDDSKGRHTTTHKQLIMLPCGAMIIDTPGMRELGMLDVSVGLGGAFSDVEQYFGKCRFSDCSHRSEPGCAIKEAIANDELLQERWNSYDKLKNEVTYNSDKATYSRNNKERLKLYAKWNKQHKKNGGKK